MMTVETTYTSLEVCKLVGISYRQLDWWLRRGIITIETATPGSGVPRVWTEKDVQRLRIVVARYEDALGIVEAFRSGALWRAAS